VNKMSWKKILKEDEKAFGKPLSYWKNLHRKSNSFPSISFNEFMMFKIAPIYKKKEDEDNE